MREAIRSADGFLRRACFTVGQRDLMDGPMPMSVRAAEIEVSGLLSF